MHVYIRFPHNSTKFNLDTIIDNHIIINQYNFYISYHFLLCYFISIISYFHSNLFPVWCSKKGEGNGNGNVGCRLRFAWKLLIVIY